MQDKLKASHIWNEEKWDWSTKWIKYSMRTCSIDSPDNIAQSDTYVVPDGPIDPYPVIRQRILRQDYARRLLPSPAFHENCVSSEQLQFVHFSLKIKFIWI